MSGRTICWIHRNYKILLCIQSAVEIRMLQSAITSLKLFKGTDKVLGYCIATLYTLLQVYEDTQTIMCQLYRYSFTIIIQTYA
jgi:hypothetical protein